MDFKTILLNRRSTRRFTSETVSRENIEMLMRAAMNAPSAADRKPWAFYAVTNAETNEKLRGATRYCRITAPLAVIVCGDLQRAVQKPYESYWVQDCSAATENLLLMADELGLGAVWCGVHPQEDNEANVRAILGLPEHLIPLNIIWVGHPETRPAPHDRYDESRITWVE